jgi:hypothetical protein
MNEEDYFDKRLEDQLQWYDAKSQFNQKWYKRLRLLEIISAAIIPFLAGMGENITYSAWIIGGLGVVIAISASSSSLYKFQENWIQYRTIAETLKHEKHLYLTKSPPYHEENAFIQLVQRVEALISQENSQWLTYINEERKINK